jgi:hypothetical protein
MKFDIRESYEKLLSHVSFHLNRTVLTTTLHKNIIYLRVFLLE